MAETYRQKPQLYEAMQYSGTNADAMISWAPTVLHKDANRKLWFTAAPDFPSKEVLATTWIIEQVDYYENVRDQYFQKTYEIYPVP
jgi:hypothetical protein